MTQSVVMNLHELYKQIVIVIELVATIMLVFGFMKTAILYFITESRQLSKTAKQMDFSSLRALLGSYILMGLDMYIVADLIHSLIEPTMQDLLMLGLIVVIRTAIGFFLSKEIVEIRHAKSSGHV
ncbi:MAG: DUF1622 domain-containing protein [Saprospiraceae bacterium]